MPRRKIKFITGEIYHIYNRGVEKRDITSDSRDQCRFLRSLNIFNTVERVGSVFDYDLRMQRGKQKGTPSSLLVEIIAFNLLDNHYHLVLKQLVDDGISKFMQSFAGGYTKYFNEKYDRVGSLFQGQFKASLLDEDFKIENTIAYVNLNHVVHGFGTSATKWGIRSSWEQYTKTNSGIVKISLQKGFNKNNSMQIVKKIINERKEESEYKRELRVPFY